MSRSSLWRSVTIPPFLQERAWLIAEVDLFFINTICWQPFEVPVVAYPYGVPELVFVDIVSPYSFF